MVPMREPQVCVTVTGRTMEELRRARDGAAHADLVEVRLDTVDVPDAVGAVEGRRRPVVVTCRASWEGGGFHGSEEERERLLTDAQAAGAEYIDVEARAEFVPAMVRRRRGRGIVLSMHAFEGVPGGSRRARPIDAVDRRRSDQDCRRRGAAHRYLHADGSGPASRVCGIERNGRTRAARDGPGRRTVADPRRTTAEPMDLRGRRCRARPDARRTAVERIPLPPDSSRRRALRGGRQSHRPLALARHAQRRLCRARIERGVCAAACRRRRRLRRLCTVDRHARARASRRRSKSRC